MSKRLCTQYNLWIQPNIHQNINGFIKSTREIESKIKDKRLIKTILKEESIQTSKHNKARDTMILDFNIYYKEGMNKIFWNLHKITY